MTMEQGNAEIMKTEPDIKKEPICDPMCDDGNATKYEYFEEQKEKKEEMLPELLTNRDCNHFESLLGFET